MGSGDASKQPRLCKRGCCDRDAQGQQSWVQEGTHYGVSEDIQVSHKQRRARSTQGPSRVWEKFQIPPNCRGLWGTAGKGWDLERIL